MATVTNMFDPEVISELRATFDKADAGKLTSYVVAWLSAVQHSLLTVSTKERRWLWID